MSYQEKRSLVSAISSIIILGVYALYVYKNYVAGNFEIVNDFKFWGKSFLYLIPVSIVAQIVIHIIFAIVNKIATNEEDPNITDERDKLIDLKSIRISHWIFTVGFFMAMGSLVIPLQPYVMFITLILSGFIAAITGEFAKFYYYRKGV